MEQEHKNYTQWHPAFYSAVQLELGANKADLEYNKEYNLNSKPLEMDLLIIKKKSNSVITNEIGKIFKKHNIFEYKSPYDNLDIDDLYKVMAYAFLYKASGKKVDEIEATDVTISLVRHNKPKKMMEKLESMGFIIENTYNGIYYINTDFQFHIQIIVSKELSEESHVWLRALTDNLSKEELERILMGTEDFEEKDDWEFITSVLTVVINENYHIFNEIKEEDTMNEPLRRLFQPEIEKLENEKNAEIENKNAEIKEKNAEIEEKNAEIEKLNAEIAMLKQKLK